MPNVSKKKLKTTSAFYVVHRGYKFFGILNEYKNAQYFDSYEAALRESDRMCGLGITNTIKNQKTSNCWVVHTGYKFFGILNEYKNAQYFDSYEAALRESDRMYGVELTNTIKRVV